MLKVYSRTHQTHFFAGHVLEGSDNLLIVNKPLSVSKGSQVDRRRHSGTDEFQEGGFTYILLTENA